MFAHEGLNIDALEFNICVQLYRGAAQVRHQTVFTVGPHSLIHLVYSGVEKAFQSEADILTLIQLR